MSVKEVEEHDINGYVKFFSVYMAHQSSSFRQENYLNFIACVFKPFAIRQFLDSVV